MIQEKRKALLFSLLFFFFSFSHASIFECQSLLDVLPHVEEETFVFYEIDEVLLKGTTLVSQIPFFNHLKEELLREGYDPEQIANKLYPIWVNVHQIAELELCQPEVFTFIEQLNEKKIPNFALTHRGPKLAYKTLDQLHLHELYVHLPYRYLHNHVFEDGLALYYEGNLFVHPICNKGDYLLKLLDFLQEKPKKIVCIENELIHLVELEEALEKRGIEFTGIYLNTQNSVLTLYDIEIGKLQLNFLEKILPDSLAKLIAERRAK